MLFQRKFMFECAFIEFQNVWKMMIVQARHVRKIRVKVRNYMKQIMIIDKSRNMVKLTRTQIILPYIILQLKIHAFLIHALMEVHAAKKEIPTYANVLKDGTVKTVIKVSIIQLYKFFSEN